MRGGRFYGLSLYELQTVKVALQMGIDSQTMKESWRETFEEALQEIRQRIDEMKIEVGEEE